MDANKKKPGFNFFWPALTSVENAERAIHGTFIAALVSGAVTTIVAILALFGHAIPGFTAANIVDALFILALAFGVRRKSRACALILFIYFILSKIAIAAASPGTGLGSGFIFILFFLNGIRSTFAYHKFKQTVINYKNITINSVIAFIYGSITMILAVVLLVMVQENPSDDAFALTAFPVILVVWGTYLGILPFSRKNERV